MVGAAFIEAKHDKVDMRSAVKHSCNVYFWKLAERVGMDIMAAVARDFGFGSPTGLGLNGDVPGRVPTKDWYRKHSEFKIGNTLNMAVTFAFDSAYFRWCLVLQSEHFGSLGALGCTLVEDRFGRLRTTLYTPAFFLVPLITTLELICAAVCHCADDATCS